MPVPMSARSVARRLNNRTQNDTAKIGVTPNSGGTIPRYMLRSVSLIHRMSIKGIPRESIFRQCLFDNVESTCVCPLGCSLQPSLCQVEWMTWQLVIPWPSSRQLLNTPTRTAATPPNPPATNDLTDSEVAEDDFKVSSAAGASLLW